MWTGPEGRSGVRAMRTPSIPLPPTTYPLWCIGIGMCMYAYLIP